MMSLILQLAVIDVELLYLLPVIIANNLSMSWRISHVGLQRGTPVGKLVSLSSLPVALAYILTNNLSANHQIDVIVNYKIFIYSSIYFLFVYVTVIS